VNGRKFIPVAFTIVAWLSPLSIETVRAAEIRLVPGKESQIEVSGLSAEELTAIRALKLEGEAWHGVLAVYVVPEGAKPLGPPVLGSYSLDGRVVRFKPRFPLAAGVRYRAVFEPATATGRISPSTPPIVREFLIPAAKGEAARVTNVFPSTDRLPENQLKFYLHFSAPMARGNVYRHIKLLDERGKEVDLPFLELDEELWDGRQQRLTLFCDPGRIKRGLKPREEVGPVLEEGKRYTLVVDAALRDANGNPLKESFRKAFRALPPDDTQPNPKTWRLQAPGAGTKDPLVVTFPKPLDHALSERLLWVIDGQGRKIAGMVGIGALETAWNFTPAEAWPAGRYHLVADTRLEDLAGNSIARPFEVDVFHPVQREVKTETVQVPFEVVAAGKK
jgi:hypothetical protein